jgi:BlaI family penicillinase repressor
MRKRKKQDEKAAELPDAELDVLACLWRRGEATAREIRQMLEPHRPMAHGSVVTLLKRLETKGAVTKEKGPVGKAFVFQASREPAPTYRQLVRKLLDRVFGGDGTVLVASLFETRPPTPDELDDLQQMLDEWREKNDARSGAKTGQGGTVR